MLANIFIDINSTISFIDTDFFFLIIFYIEQ